MKAEWFIQYVEGASDRHLAAHTLEGLQALESYAGGRIIPPSPEKPEYRVQAFFLPGPNFNHGQPLPDGCRAVLVPVSVRALLGINDGGAR